MFDVIAGIALNLGDTNGLLEKAIEEAALEELDFEPACQSPSHNTGKHGHDPDQVAAWSVLPPCGAALLTCDSWVTITITYRSFICACRSVHKTADCSFIPLAQTGGES